MKLPVMLYVQHLLGVGHLHRTVRIAHALRELDLEVTLVSGGLPVPGLNTDGLTFVQLPSVRAADESFSALLKENGSPVDEPWRAMRREALLAAFQRIRPRVLVTEMFPFGRRQMRFELLPLLEAVRAAQPRPWLVSSVRDILVQARDPERYREMAELAEDHFDRVLVHGDPGLIHFARTFPLAERIAGKLYHTGYVVGEAPPPPGARGGEKEVLVSTGSREGGRHLLEAALAARPLTALSGRPWRILASLQLPMEQLRRYEQQAPAGVTVERFRPDFTALLRHAELCISQGGYNTTMEVLRAGVRPVLAPYTGGRDSEQALRAQLLSERGAVVMLPWEELGPARLAEAVDEAFARPPAGRLRVDMNGAAASAALIREMARFPSPPGSAN
ncbi:MAG: glycosyltransferase [SAR324 cluster bacterium]|nr:glycosyltransferase [SAR324 cluster bacterium]